MIQTKPLLTRGTSDTRMHYGKKARQCDASDHVLPGNLGSCHLSIVADHVHPLMETVFPDGCGLFQQDHLP